MKELFLQPIFLIVLCGILGNPLGRLGYKHFKLGSSATLFVGLMVRYFGARIGLPMAEIPNALFTASLIAFIVSVGLRASKSIKGILKTYGYKFLLLAIVVTAAGAVSTGLLMAVLEGMSFEVIGTYVGALTSSPGLATALELSENFSMEATSKVGMGYAVSYIPGVLIVILFSQWMGSHKERHLPRLKKEKPILKAESFDVNRFFMVIALGILIGWLEVPIGQGMTFSLGITGGTLISALLLGSTMTAFTFDSKVLEVIKSIGLTGFLAIVGLNYGETAVSAIGDSGVLLLGIGFLTGTVSLFVGYVFGKYVLKMDQAILVGGICGSMTSTPGLGAAMEAFDDEDVVIGYGAAYPFALLTVIVFTNFLIK